MRVGPFEFLHGPGLGDQLVRIEHGEGMMGEGLARQERHGSHGKEQGFELHRTGLPKAYDLPI